MSRLPRLSGVEIIKILTKEFGFSVAHRKGSHVTLRKFVEGRKVVTVVPLHREVKIGTLFGILELGKISKEEFMAKLK